MNKLYRLEFERCWTRRFRDGHRLEGHGLQSGRAQERLQSHDRLDSQPGADSSNSCELVKVLNLRILPVTLNEANYVF